MGEEAIKIITGRLDRIEQLTLIGVKTVLNLDEAVVFTGLSKGHIYRMTSEQKIPHFKKCRHLYFKKTDLEDWLLEHKVPTKAEIDIEASTYVATHQM